MCFSKEKHGKEGGAINTNIKRPVFCRIKGSHHYYSSRLHNYYEIIIARTRRSTIDPNYRIQTKFWNGRDAALLQAWSYFLDISIQHRCVADAVSEPLRRVSQPYPEASASIVQRAFSNASDFFLAGFAPSFFLSLFLYSLPSFLLRGHGHISLFDHRLCYTISKVLVRGFSFPSPPLAFPRFQITDDHLPRNLPVHCLFHPPHDVTHRL